MVYSSPSRLTENKWQREACNSLLSLDIVHAFYHSHWENLYEACLLDIFFTCSLNKINALLGSDPTGLFVLKILTFPAPRAICDRSWVCGHWVLHSSSHLDKKCDRSHLRIFQCHIALLGKSSLLLETPLRIWWWFWLFSHEDPEVGEALRNKRKCQLAQGPPWGNIRLGL